MLQLLLSQGSLLLMFGLLVIAGLGVPLPEDLVLLAAGALVHRKVTSLALAAAACVCGVIAGDMILFITARRLGPAILERPLFRRILPPGRRERIESFIRRRGGLAVFLGRHAAGLRSPVFAMAGVLGMPLGRFVLWDTLGLLVSAPWIIAAGYFFSEHLELARRGIAHVEHYLLLAAVLVFVGYVIYATWRRSRGSTGHSTGGK